MSQTVEEIVERGGDVLDDVVEALHDGNEHYSWVGIYFVEGGDLVLGPWKGPHATEHVRIPVGEGVCGAAAASGVTEVVDDDTVAKEIVCGPDPEKHLEKIRAYAQAGYDHVCIHHVGSDQAGFMHFYAREILPNLRKLKRAA